MNKFTRIHNSIPHLTMTLIADSGSTKTAWALVDNSSQLCVVRTQGINPFLQTESEICAVLRDELLPSLTARQSDSNTLIARQGVDPANISSVFFYGAGCTPEKAPVVAAALRAVLPSAGHVSVESDMLGAARAVCGSQPGIVCILGTGSNSCYYDGSSTQSGIPALGYILGDEGSGAYIGKRLAADVLKRQLPDDVCRLFLQETSLTQADIIQRVYREPMPNRFLASLSPFCARHRHIPAIHDLLIDCFTQFFRRNIVPLPTPVPSPDVHFVGSIAHHYRHELSLAATRCGYSLGNIIQSPLEGLVRHFCESN